jgi:GntR family transcriptional regulator/MocR family aminotransferase
MEDSWSSSSSVDLHLTWRGEGGSRGLTAALREAIRDGRLVAGAELPSTRVLAAELGVARGTVTRAYGDLTAEGYLRTTQGAPTTVARIAAPPRHPAPTRPRPWLGDAARWDLMPGRPDLSSFPRALWAAAMRSVLSEAASEAFGYGDVGGAWPLREALAGYLGRTRGVVVDPDRVLVCGGFSHAVATTTGVLRDRGVGRVAFENPSLSVFRDLVASHGMDIQPVQVDELGIRVAAIDAPAVVVTPAHQFPTGVTLAPGRRAELIAWAGDTGGLVVEDDYDGEFRFDGQQVGALQSMAPEQVVYTGTVSKTLAPALRIGWIVPPHALVDHFRDALTRGGWRPPILEQLALTVMLENGDYDRHVRRRRRVYRDRRRRLCAALLESGLPGTVSASGIAAGLQTTVLTPGIPEAVMRAAARRHDVSVAYPSSFWMGPGPGPDGVVVGYSTPADHAFTPALEALLAALRSAAS